jgi:hypothetical protein
MTECKTRQQLIEGWERKTTHSEYCWRWHHTCALKKFFNLDAPKNAPQPSVCNHQWLAVTGQPIYKCAHCGMFMRVEK